MAESSDVSEFHAHHLQARFLKSSPKISLYPKATRGSVASNRSQSAASTPRASVHLRGSVASPSPRGTSPFDQSSQRSSSPGTSSVTWICQICAQPNQLPPHFDASTASVHTSLAPCSTCGVKPPLAQILKAAISTASGRQAAKPTEPPSQPLLESHQQTLSSLGGQEKQLSLGNPPNTGSSFQCPRCTFLNHPSLPNCELCGAFLISVDLKGQIGDENPMQRPESPGPTMANQAFDLNDDPEYIKLSFRCGGDKIFHERLKGAMLQRKWLLQNAPPVPRPDRPLGRASDNVHNQNGQADGAPPLERSTIVGIAGLERRGLELRKNNEVVLNNAFEDLEALMASAKEVVALAEQFAKKAPESGSEAADALLESATALGMVTTKDMLGSSAGSETLYLSELSRNVAEYLTDDAKGILRKEGGIMSLVDLWAVFNRARGGVELISPMDFEKAARLWDRLNLPVRLRQFKNGLLVVQRHDWTDDKTIAQLLDWLQELHVTPPSSEVLWNWEAFGRGVTAQEAAQRFGWSVGVATEELEMAEEKGALCREESVEGLRFWENWITEEGDLAKPALDMDSETLAVTRNLVDLGLW